MPKENVAIVLAVSEYTPQNSLPGCKNDGLLMRGILEKTGRYPADNTLHLDTNTSSGTVKAALATFVAALSGRSIGEVFFYYTGHGLFDGSDFYYLLSDYSSARKQATSLANTELDQMLRSLAPDIAVKVIDACYSGQQYVKSPDDYEKAIKATAVAYKSCYFMFSSEQTQPSWQDGNLSYFTLEFAKAIHQHHSHTIRYKDIIDYISDSFSTNARQKPVFVAQASFTEEFSPVDDAIRGAIAPFLPASPSVSLPSASAPLPAKRPANDRLKELVRTDAERYCEETEIVTTFETIKQRIAGYQLPDPLVDLYGLSPVINTDQYDVPNPVAIGEWLTKNQGDYFAKVLREDEEYQTEEAIRGGFISPLYPQYRTVTRHRSIVSGFDTTADIPFKSIHLTATPKFQNLPWWKWYCAFVVSKSSIRAFVTYVRLKELNWKDRRVAGKVEWQIKEWPMKDSLAVGDKVTAELDGFSAALARYLMEKYGLDDSQPG